MFNPFYFYGRYFYQRYWPPAGAADESRFLLIEDLANARGLTFPEMRVNYVLVQAQVADVRYRDDGVSPTGDIGLLLYAGDPPTKFAGSIQLLKFITKTGGSGRLAARFF